MDTLREAVEGEILASGADAVGVAFYHPSSGNQLFCDADRSFHPASTFKLCVMMEAFRRAAEGTFSLDGAIRVTGEFPSIVDGSLYCPSLENDSDPELHGLIGTEVTARDLIKRMIVRSGNLATNVLLEHLGASSVTSFMHRLGAKDLVVCRGIEDRKAYALGRNNAATARDLTTCLSRLAAHEVVSPEADQAMVDVLTRQRYNEGIPRHLPSTAKVAHKTGWDGLLYHDAAIVYPKGEPPYVLTVMTQGLSDEDAGPELVAKISRLVYDGRQRL